VKYGYFHKLSRIVVISSEVLKERIDESEDGIKCENPLSDAQLEKENNGSQRSFTLERLGKGTTASIGSTTLSSRKRQYEGFMDRLRQDTVHSLETTKEDVDVEPSKPVSTQMTGEERKKAVEAWLSSRRHNKRHKSIEDDIAVNI
jgi:hypothetical protein